MKAYVVYQPGSFVDHPEQGGVYFADTASKARYRAYLTIRELGYDVGLVGFVVRRAAKYDPLDGTLDRFDGWSRETANRLLAEAKT